MKNSKQGFILPLLSLIVVFFIVLLGIYFYNYPNNSNRAKTEEIKIIETLPESREKTNNNDNTNTSVINTNQSVNNSEQLVGNDSDEHGCIASA
jgi:flagellar basal body-associated protein FliL